MICHSLRFLHFGLQIVEHGKIVDYACANDYWHELKDDACEEWSHYEKRWRPLYLETRNRYPDVPIAPVDVPHHLPENFRTLYRYIHDSGSSNTPAETIEREVLAIARSHVRDTFDGDDRLAKAFEATFDHQLVDVYRECASIIMELCEALEKQHQCVLERIAHLEDEARPAMFASMVKRYYMDSAHFKARRRSRTITETLLDPSQTHMNVFHRYVQRCRELGVKQAVDSSKGSS